MSLQPREAVPGVRAVAVTNPTSRSTVPFAARPEAFRLLRDPAFGR